MVGALPSLLGVNMLAFLSALATICSSIPALIELGKMINEAVIIVEKNLSDARRAAALKAAVDKAKASKDTSLLENVLSGRK